MLFYEFSLPEKEILTFYYCNSSIIFSWASCGAPFWYKLITWFLKSLKNVQDYVKIIGSVAVTPSYLLVMDTPFSLSHYLCY